MADIATLGIKVDSRGVVTATKDLQKMEGQGRKTEISTRALVKTFGALGGAAILGAAIRSTTEFSQSIADLSAITGATGQDLAYYREQAAEIGRTTSLSASQAAEAFKLIASAKPDLLSSAEALNEVTRQAVTLAEAAGIELPQAASALGSALNQFGIDASKAGEVINILAAGAKFGAAEIPAITEALRNAGPAANALGVDLAETVAGIEALAIAGRQGADAGTGLRQVLLRLEKTANADLMPSVVGLSKALINLKSQNLSNTELMKLFGDEAFTAGTALLSQADSLSKLNGQLRGTNTAVEQAATRMDTLAGDVKELKSAIDGLAIKVFGGDVEKTNRALVQFATEGVNGLTDNIETLTAAAEALAVVMGARFAGPIINSFASATASQVAFTSAVLKGNVVALGSAKANLQMAVAAEAAARADVAKAASANAVAAADLNAARAAAARIPGFALNTAAMEALAAAEATAAKTSLAYKASTDALAASQARLTVAMRSATLGARAASVAMGTLRSTMAFLGGPAGLVLTVAGGIWALSSSFEEGIKPAGDYAQELAGIREEAVRLERLQVQKRIREINQEIQALRDKQKGEGLFSLPLSGKEWAEVQQEINDANRLLNEYKDNLADLEKREKEEGPKGKNDDSGTGPLGSDADKARNSLQNLSLSLKQQAATLSASETEVLAYRLSLGDLSDEVKLLGAEGKKLTAEIIANAKALEAAREAEETATSYNEVTTALQQQRSALQLTAREQFIYEASARLSINATDEMRKETERLAGALYDEQKAMERDNALKAEAKSLVEELTTPTEQYSETIAKLSELLRAGLIDQREFNAAVKKAQEDFKEASKDTTDEITEFWKRAAENMQDAMSDLFFDAMRGDLGDLEQSFKQTIDRMVAELLASQLLNFLKDEAIGGTFGGLAQNLVGSAVSGSAGGSINYDYVSNSGFAPDSFDGGGFTGFGSRSGGVDGKGGFPAILHPNEIVSDLTKGQSPQSSKTVNVNISVSGMQNSADLRRSASQIAQQAGAAAHRALSRDG